MRAWAVVVAQLVELSLPIPEVQVSNPVIGKIYIEHLFTFSCIEKTKIKKKEARNSPSIVHVFFNSRVYKQSPKCRAGALVMGGDLCSKGHGFKFRWRILNGHNISSHIFVVTIIMFV